VSYKKLIPFINGENELAANVVTMAEDYFLVSATGPTSVGYIVVEI